MLLAVRFVLAPLLPRQRAAAGGRAPAGLLARAARRPRAAGLLPAVVVVDLVYRQLYTTLPLHLRDDGQPVAALRRAHRGRAPG